MGGSNLYTGTLDLLILRSLRRGALHGYAIGKWLAEVSAGELQIEEGALYPALHRLERAGWLVADWGRTESNRQAKFYSLTDAGKRQLAGETRRWNTHADAVAAVLDADQRAS